MVGFVAAIIARHCSLGRMSRQDLFLPRSWEMAGAFVATNLGPQLGWYHLDQRPGFIGATVGAVIVLSHGAP
jgi:uncharacterized membrane protein YeaQ/YmgE (transglycosylase-associated protein family)